MVGRTCDKAEIYLLVSRAGTCRHYGAEGACRCKKWLLEAVRASQCTLSVSRSPVSESTSSTAIIGMTAAIQAPLGAESSDSTGTKTTAAGATEFTGVAPSVVAGQVGVLALVAAFLLA